MNVLHKILVLAALLLLFAVSLCALSLLYYMPFITDTVEGYMMHVPVTKDIFIGFGTFLCIFFFLLLLIVLFTPNKRHNLIVPKEKGKLVFSRQTLESTVKYSFSDIKGIQSSRVRAKIHKRPEKTKIYVKLSLNDPNTLVESTELMQNKIESVLKSSMGITVESIDIKVTEFAASTASQKENQMNAAADSRVI